MVYNKTIPTNKEMVKLTKTELNARSEMALMGIVMEVPSNDTAADMMDYILEVLDASKPVGHIVGSEIVRDAFQFMDSNPVITHIVVNQVDDMRLITLVIDTDNEKNTHLTDPDGVFCYVYNIDVPYFSELGYTWFKYDGNFYRRRG